MALDSDPHLALERLYEIFSRYPLLDNSEVCEHCVAPEVLESIHAVPLRQLSASALGHYAWNVSTWGEIEDFKHYLPRLLELLISEELDGVHAPVLMGWLGVHWHAWPQDERDAVVSVIDEWWHQTLLHYPRDIDVMDMFEIIGTNLELDLHGYLAVWESIGSEAAALHLTRLIQEYTQDALYGEVWSALLEHWVGGPAPARVLEAALSSSNSHQTKQNLSQALALHRWRGNRPTDERELDAWWSQMPN